MLCQDDFRVLGEKMSRTDALYFQIEGRSKVNRTNEKCTYSVEEIRKAYSERETRFDAIHVKFQRTHDREFLEVDAGGLEPVNSGIAYAVEGGFRDLLQFQDRQVNGDDRVASLDYRFNGQRSRFNSVFGGVLISRRSPEDFQEVVRALNRQLLFITPDEFASRTSQDLCLSSSLSGEKLSFCKLHDHLDIVDSHRCVLLNLGDILYLWLDPTTGFAPRRCVRLETFDDRPGTIAYLAEYTNHQQLSNGVFVPFEYSFHAFGVGELRREYLGELQSVARISFTSFLTNEEVDEAVFDLDFPPNTFVRDVDSGQTYITRSPSKDIESTVKAGMSRIEYRGRSTLESFFWGFNFCLAVSAAILFGVRVHKKRFFQSLSSSEPAS